MTRSYVFLLTSGVAAQIGIMIATGEIIFPAFIGLAVYFGLNSIRVAIEKVGERLTDIAKNPVQ